MFIQPAGLIFPPAGTLIRLVLSSPGSARLAWKPGWLGETLGPADLLCGTTDLQEAHAGIKPTRKVFLRSIGRVQSGGTLTEGDTLGSYIEVKVIKTAVSVRHLKVVSV